MNNKKHSALYRHIESLHADRPWGSLLDAGTGISSMRWLTSLNTESWTAITGSSSHARRVKEVCDPVQREQDRLIVANWADPSLLENETFDTVLADYLLGAIEGYSPYFQPYLFPRLRPLTKKCLYITGREPYVAQQRPKDRASQIVWEIGRYRDACQLFAGDIPYREYPANWVIHHLEKSGFAVRSCKHFPIHTKEKFINGQINLCKPALKGLADQDLAKALESRGERLRTDALNLLHEHGGALRTGHNYVISAEPV